MSYQSLLDIPVLQPPCFANFVAGNNQQIVDTLINTLEKLKLTTHTGHTGFSSALLSGDTIGHTHILQSLDQLARQETIKSVYLSCKHLQNPELLITDLDKHYQLVLIDHLELCCANPLAERALFGLFNNIWSQNKLLVLACHTVFNKLTFRLADLKTRVQSGLIWQLQPLDDAQQKELLQKRIMRYGLNAKPKLIDYLWQRIPRDESLQVMIIDKLITLALQTKQKPNIDLAKKVLV